MRGEWMGAGKRRRNVGNENDKQAQALNFVSRVTSSRCCGTVVYDVTRARGSLGWLRFHGVRRCLVP